MSKKPGVSTFIKRWTRPFDPDGEVLRKCAAKEGITPDEMKAIWNKKGEESIAKGNAIHEFLDLRLKGAMYEGVRLPEYDAIDELISKYEILDTETWINYRNEFNLNGRYDLRLMVHGREAIADLKTGKAADATVWENLLPPFDKVGASKLQMAKLQVCIYCRIQGISDGYVLPVGETGFYLIPCKEEDFAIADAMLKLRLEEINGN